MLTPIYESLCKLYTMTLQADKQFTQCILENT